MKQKFEVILLDDVWEFFDTVDEKTKTKIIYNIDKSKYINDPELFKKLEDEIWEFRTIFKRLHFRLLAFWDKTDNIDTFVIVTHGIVKKTSKVPKSDIEKAKAAMRLYFERKNKK
ncbi:MAG: type II toxin-antitoxin system RelE/ParE family toxin [Bacteroidales bacterium]|nr:type II toxin-antitoxin system RelE/ParE family toxin [Bacteroidales bacterium]